MLPRRKKVRTAGLRPGTVRLGTRRVAGAGPYMVLTSRTSCKREKSHCWSWLERTARSRAECWKWSTAIFRLRRYEASDTISSNLA